MQIVSDSVAMETAVLCLMSQDLVYFANLWMVE